jgi:hypothetical protein
MSQDYQEMGQVIRIFGSSHSAGSATEKVGNEVVLPLGFKTEKVFTFSASRPKM